MHEFIVDDGWFAGGVFLDDNKFESLCNFIDSIFPNLNNFYYDAPQKRPSYFLRVYRENVTILNIGVYDDNLCKEIVKNLEQVENALNCLGIKLRIDQI